MPVAIIVESLSKAYQLGQKGTGTFSWYLLGQSCLITAMITVVGGSFLIG